MSLRGPNCAWAPPGEKHRFGDSRRHYLLSGRPTAVVKWSSIPKDMNFWNSPETCSNDSRLYQYSVLIVVVQHARPLKCSYAFWAWKLSSKRLRLCNLVTLYSLVYYNLNRSRKHSSLRTSPLIDLVMICQCAVSFNTRYAVNKKSRLTDFAFRPVELIL